MFAWNLFVLTLFFLSTASDLRRELDTEWIFDYYCATLTQINPWSCSKQCCCKGIAESV